LLAGNRSFKKTVIRLCRRAADVTTTHLTLPPRKWTTSRREFAHNDAECGTCHEGDAWRNQYSGHILRRYIGNHLNKNVSNKLCADCHGNIDKMANVEQEDPKTHEKKAVTLDNLFMQRKAMTKPCMDD
jgi:hypothetical protein